MKQRVLETAFRGELVKQHPEDGNAKDLIARIQSEKEKLIKEKKIKKETNFPDISKEELRYDIPPSWIWTRLGGIGDWGAGATPKRGNPAFWNNGTIPWLKTGELNNSYINTSEEFITEEAFKGSSVRLNKPGDILIAMYGATIGKLGILEIEATTNQACCACTTFNGVYNMYLFYYLMASKQSFIESSEGGAQPNISRTKIIRHVMPLPPYLEQKRIVSKIEEIFSIIDKIAERKEDALQTIQLIRQTTLQQAIQGKLVGQNMQNESASELLIKIHEEKEQLIEKGEIRKQTKLPKVKTEELPFEIPSNWRWARIGNIINEIFGGGTPSKSNPLFWNGDIPWASVKDISKDDIYLETTIDSITENGFENCSGKMIDVGDIIVITRMGLGRIVISNISTAINQDLKGIKLSSQIVPKYFLYAYKNNDIKGTGTTVKGITQKDLLNTLIPVPPRAEQEKIVKKIEQVMNICDQMEELFK